MNGMASTLPPLSWSSFAHFHVEPWWSLFSLVTLATYLAAVGIARRSRVRSVHLVRVASFTSGILVLLFTVSSAIDTYAMAVFWDHMIEHLLLIMVVPALLVVGHPLTALRAATSTIGRESAVDGVARSWPVSVVIHPLVALALYTDVIIGTHLTRFMDAMAIHGWLMSAEQWLYLGTGYLLLLPLLGAEPVRSSLPYLGRIGLLLIAMVPDTVVGIVLLQTNHDLFPVMESAHPSWAPGPVDDLHIGGGLMWAGGDGLMMLFAVGVTLVMISHPGSELVLGRRLDTVRRRTLTQHAGLDGGPMELAESADVDEATSVLEAYNRMLARMNGVASDVPDGRDRT